MAVEQINQLGLRDWLSRVVRAEKAKEVDTKMKGVGMLKI
jgi:hypothetical protein